MTLFKTKKTGWMRSITLCFLFILNGIFVPSTQANAADKPLRFSISFDKTVQPTPYSGRVYIMMTQDLNREPRLSRNWFNPPPVFAIDVTNVPPGGTVILDSTARAFPVNLSQLTPGRYRVQAVARRNPDNPQPGKGAGDLFSLAQTIDLSPETSGNIEFSLNQVVQEEPFQETKDVKLVEIVSPTLSEFHHRQYKMRAAISLPEHWPEQPNKAYPVVYYITGFGGSHKSIFRMRKMMGDLPRRVILVIPDATNYYGHSVFANSDNIGPWGQALTEELIPFIEKKYHASGDATDRYVTGISSGGWSSLWLQITYPDVFNGCWSIVPDPVDFHDFQRINLYAANANMYRDANGNRRPLARYRGKVMIWYDDFVHLESVLGPGGQIRSFEAVFSPRGDDGKPVPLFDRKTGAVNPATAQSWKRYDINLILKNNWQTLRPKLAGKLHIFAGEKDTFYLEGAVRILKRTLTELGSDADVRIVDDMTHEAPPGVFDAMLKEITQHANVQETTSP